MIIGKAEYDGLMRTGELVRWMDPKKKRIPARTFSRKGGSTFTNGPVKISKQDGTQIEAQNPILTKGGCPVSAGETVYVRWREQKPLDWRQGDPLPPLRGGLLLVFAEGVYAEEEPDRWRWRVTFKVTTKKRPAPDKAPGVYLAPTAGYGPRSTSIDREVPVIPNEDVDRIRADELAHRRAIQRAKVGKIKEQIAEVAEGEQDTEVRRKLTDLDRTADYLASILTDEDRAA